MLEQLKQSSLLTKRRIVHHLIHNIIFNCIMHTDKQMNVSYQASLVNRHIRRFTGVFVCDNVLTIALLGRIPLAIRGVLFSFFTL